MYFSRPIQWYHSQAYPIWPYSTFKIVFKAILSGVCQSSEHEMAPNCQKSLCGPVKKSDKK